MAAKQVRCVLGRASVELMLGADGALPAEFCIFQAGENPNYNNEAAGDPQPVYTPKSAASLRADAQKKATDYFGDLEHASIDPATKRARADACDAMVWYELDFRADGSLWAINVRWSDEGARRLRAKLQRYISPVFLFHSETGEILEFVNVALTSNPATYGIAPLVAASRGDVARANDRATPAALALLSAIVVAKLTRKKHEPRTPQKDPRGHRKR